MVRTSTVGRVAAVTEQGKYFVPGGGEGVLLIFQLLTEHRFCTVKLNEYHFEKNAYRTRDPGGAITHGLKSPGSTT